MNRILEGRVALVTGASKGIGAGIAKALAAAGASVAVNYASDSDAAQRVVADIERGGGRAIPVKADISKGDQVRNMVAVIVAALGPLDVLVNNASVYRFMPLDAITEAEFHRQFDTNVLGTILVTQEAVRHFRKEGGSIVNIGSLASNGSGPAQALYAATKAGLNALTAVFALELAPRNIRVNGILPGYTDTEGARTLGVAGTDMERRLLEQTPLGRAGTPEDFGPVAVFLASNASAWITGDTLKVSGGLR
jgi:3-oxoacyl-[acyl-carrier protein] reductase